MTDREEIFKNIDSLIERVENMKDEQLFNIEKTKRNNKSVSPFLADNEILKTLSYLIAYSQNAKSENVEKTLSSGKFDEAFENFDIEKVVRLNPCDISDNYWESIKGIRQQAKLFHIVSLARKIKSIDSFSKILNDTNIPKKISSKKDIDNFWDEFNELSNKLKNKKIPFFQSTTSLLHFLLEIGYDCVKPDLVVMKVAKKLGIVENETNDKDLKQAVRIIQEYSLERHIRPSIVDLYFLIDGEQTGAKKFLREEYRKKIKINQLFKHQKITLSHLIKSPHLHIIISSN